jgi:hypothetical protein
MGNTCGCVDPAEKDGEVKVEKSQKVQHSNAQINNYRDSTLSKGYAGSQMQKGLTSGGIPHLFDTDDQYLLDLQKNAQIQGLAFVEELAFENGAVYKGYLHNEMRHGPGVQVWPDNAKYEGEWRENKANGRGKFWHADGDIYEGEWEDDKANGFGIYIHVNGAQYEGYWKNDLQDGQGMESW